MGEPRNNEKKDITAIVIGVGPAGLATALGLSQVLKHVILIEKSSQFGKRGSTFGLGSNGYKALEEVSPGIGEKIKEVGLSTKPFGSDGYMMIWWQMRDLLLNQAQQKNNNCSNITLYTGRDFTQITQIQQDGKTKVVVHFESKKNIDNKSNNDEAMIIVGDFIVGADGVHSNVRKHLQLSDTIQSSNVVYRGSVTVTDTCSAELKQVLEKGLVPLGAKTGDGLYFLVFNYHTKQPGRLTWTLSIKEEQEKEPESPKSNNNDDDNNSQNQKTTTTDPYTILNNHIADDKDYNVIKEILDMSDDKAMLVPFPKSRVVDFSDEELAQYPNNRWGGKGLVTLLGDAAHAMCPTDGYGGNMAFEDAVVLMRLFQKNGNNKNDNNIIDIPTVLAQFEAMRLPRVKKIHDNQRERYNQRMNGQRLGPQTKEFKEWIDAGV